MIAHSMQIVGGMGGTLTMNSVEVNPEIDEAQFAMPEPAPEPEPAEEEATETDGA